MALIDDFNAARDSTFRARVTAALWKRAVNFLGTIIDPALETDARRLRLANRVLNTREEGMQIVANAMASAGLTVASNDSQIQTAIDNNWDLIGLLFDTKVNP